MPLEENIYTASQINIPADLPDLLKQFTKAAIKTQPTDILQWLVYKSSYKLIKSKFIFSEKIYF